MNRKIVLKEPVNVIYEGRILEYVIRVFEIHLLRSGKPWRVLAKDLKNPQKQAAPYEYEYLDYESRERLDKIIANSELQVITQ